MGSGVVDGGTPWQMGKDGNFLVFVRCFLTWFTISLRLFYWLSIFDVVFWYILVLIWWLLDAFIFLGICPFLRMQLQPAAKR